ncbi:hypothetical protein DFH11DRAFT_1879124 [Phellopilus nigrolimitatus]|nr:hypothetical protein DFH11DRAFT_1879124 [Phellopilus nigrolimitatus]
MQLEQEKCERRRVTPHAGQIGPNTHVTGSIPGLSTANALYVSPAMMTHQTLYNLANALGLCAVFSVLAYHFVAVNARQLQHGAGAGVAAARN